MQNEIFKSEEQQVVNSMKMSLALEVKDGLDATMLQNLGVYTWQDLLALDEEQLRHTSGLDADKFAALQSLIFRARRMSSHKEEDLITVLPGHHPVFQEIDPRGISGLGRTTLSRLGVKTWFDLLGLDEATLDQQPGVGRNKVLVITELIKQARVMHQGECPNLGASICEKIQSHGVDVSRPATEVLRKLSTRPTNALEKIEADLAHVIEMVEKHQLKHLDGVGNTSRDEISAHVKMLAEHGLSYYLFGEQGKPTSTRDGVKRILDELVPVDRILVRRRYRDGATLEELGQDMGQTRERVRQRLDKVVQDAAALYFEAFHELLGPFLSVLDDNSGLLDLERALELSPGDEDTWELLFAMDVLGRDARIYGNALCCGLTADTREDLLKEIDSVLKDLPLRQIRLYQAKACLESEFAIELEDAALTVLLDELLDYPREDETSWRNLGVTEGRLYAAAIERSLKPLSLSEIAELYQSYTRDLDAPDVGHVYCHLQRTELVYRLEEGLYIHRDHLPVDEQDLLDVAEIAAQRIHEQAAIVDVEDLRQELLSDGTMDAVISTALLHYTLARREDLKSFKGSNTELAPAGSGLERATLTEQIEDIVQSFGGVVVDAEIYEQLIQHGIETSDASARQSLVKSADIVYIGKSRFIHRKNIGLTESFLLGVIEAVKNNLPEDSPIGIYRALENLDDDPAACFLLAREDGPEILWGIFHEQDDVSTGLAGKAVMRKEIGEDPLDVAFENYIKEYSSFSARDIKDYLDAELGFTECGVALSNRIRAACENGLLDRVNTEYTLRNVHDIQA